jgi:hypothetical protein
MPSSEQQVEKLDAAWVGGRFRGPSTPLRVAQDDAMSECWSGGGGLEVETLDKQAEDVFEGEVGLLDVHGDGGWDGDEVVAEVAHSAAACSGEAYGGDLHFAGLFEGAEDVGRVAGGGDAQEEIAGLAECFDLAGKDLVEAEVVAACGEDGGVSGEGDGAKGGAGVGEADDELGDEVLGVGGGASVTGYEELVAGLHGFGGEFGDVDEGVGDGFVGEDGLHGGDGLSELLLDEMLHRFSGVAFGAGARVRDEGGNVEGWS